MCDDCVYYDDAVDDGDDDDGEVGAEDLDVDDSVNVDEHDYVCGCLVACE